MFRVSRPILGRFLTPIRVVPIVPIRFSSDKIDTKKLILKLRQESGLPLGQCRNALMATNWDMDAAKIHIQEEAKKLGLKKMESLASRKVPEGLVGVAQSGKKSAMVVVKCESEPVSKTPEFNRLVQFVASALTSQNPGEYESEALLALDGVKDNLVENIGLLKENIQIQRGICVEAENCGFYVRSKNQDFPNNGTYGSIVGLAGGSTELSSDLATHCVLELPAESGDLPNGLVDLDVISDDEARLFYQPLNGGQEPVFNALQRENTELLCWHRYQIIA